jgi:pyruvate dehydrogenase E2 component (dihydrolipoamide acetyltransferase)
MRSEFNAKLEGEVKLSVNDFIIKAAACALKKNPVVNSSWSDNAVRQ